MSFVWNLPIGVILLLPVFPCLIHLLLDAALLQKVTFLPLDKPLYQHVALVNQRDAEDHYTFIESQPSTNGKRNPHVFVGRFITITRQDDGTLRPNFKPIKKGAGWSVESYARSVYDELREALNGLVEEV